MLCGSSGSAVRDVSGMSETFQTQAPATFETLDQAAGSQSFGINATHLNLSGRVRDALSRFFLDKRGRAFVEHFYSGMEVVEAASGARLFHKNHNDRLHFIAGQLYDVSSFLYLLSEQPGKVNLWKFGSLVHAVRNSFGSFKDGFYVGKVRVLSRENPHTKMHEIALYKPEDGNNADYVSLPLSLSGELDIFRLEGERELIEEVTGSPRMVFDSLLRENVHWRNNPFLRMINSSQDPDQNELEDELQKNEFSMDAGIRLNPKGRVSAFVLLFYDMGNVVAEWIGRPSDDYRSIVWEVDLNYRPNLSRIRQVAQQFRSDIFHSYINPATISRQAGVVTANDEVVDTVVTLRSTSPSPQTQGRSGGGSYLSHRRFLNGPFVAFPVMRAGARTVHTSAEIFCMSPITPRPFSLVSQAW